MSMSVHQRKRSTLMMVAALLLLLFIVGCSNKESGSASSSASGDQAASAKSITMSWPRDIGTMNPHTYNPSQLFAQSMIYEPLVSYQKDGKLGKHWLSLGPSLMTAKYIHSSCAKG